MLAGQYQQGRSLQLLHCSTAARVGWPPWAMAGIVKFKLLPLCHNAHMASAIDVHTSCLD
jgi:hypothetical protein